MSSWFCMIMPKFHIVRRNALKSYNCYCWIFLFRTTMRNWLSSCEMVILLLNSSLLDEEVSRRQLRWCQVSTWPWILNNNLIFSWKSCFWTLLIVEFSRFSLSIEFSIFLHFFFLTSQTCLVRPNLQAWVTKSRFSQRNEDLEARFMVN